MRGMYKVITFPLLFQTLTLFSTGLNVGSTEAVSTKDKYNSITQSITQHEEIGRIVLLYYNTIVQSILLRQLVCQD